MEGSPHALSLRFSVEWRTKQGDNQVIPPGWKTGTLARKLCGFTTLIAPQSLLLGRRKSRRRRRRTRHPCNEYDGDLGSPALLILILTTKERPSTCDAFRHCCFCSPPRSPSPPPATFPSSVVVGVADYDEAHPSIRPTLLPATTRIRAAFAN